MKTKCTKVAKASQSSHQKRLFIEYLFPIVTVRDQNRSIRHIVGRIIMAIRSLYRVGPRVSSDASTMLGQLCKGQRSVWDQLARYDAQILRKSQLKERKAL